jgi:glutamyl-tRNA synthetase
MVAAFDNSSVTRLAPSPTGALHLGNARTFLVNHLLAVQQGWRTIMRIEDLDGPRIKPGAAQALLEELAWLGLTWQGPPVHQSTRANHYKAALEELRRTGAVYPCTCSRRDVELAAGAPHADDCAGVYGGTCRGKYADADEARTCTGRAPAWRCRVDGGAVAVDDRFAGRVTFDLSRTCGDFVVFKADGTSAYQLAVVVDDAAAGVNRIVRGDDLLESAARQTLLRGLLGLAPSPLYWHLPLVVGADGRRLAKRHGDTRLSHYRARGATPQRVLGLLGYWCGVLPKPQETGMAELVSRFDIARLSKSPVVFRQQDEKFLI